MVVVWNEPVNDGGSTVLGYHLERKERNSILWVKLNKSLIQDTSYKTTGLEPGQEYEFRVYAENIVGIGKVSKLSEGHISRDPCDPPGDPEATKITKDSVTITWTKPEYDGGANVTGYIVEKKELPEGRWNKTNFTNIIETEYVATSLVENQKYEFRVIARNAAGVFSLPSYSTGPITAKDEIDPPRISIDPQFTQTVYVNAGDGFKIDADVHGSPIPEILWMKHGHEAPLANTITRDIKNTDSTTLLTVKEAKLEDGGKYTLLLKNPGGEKSVKINVVVLDKPGAPQGPISVTGITNDQCCLAWKSPLYDGGSKITHYIVERRETSRLVWTVVDNKCESNYLKVTKLLEGNEYIFKVQATSISLAWEKPEHDGGSRIIQYLLEIQPKGSEKWSGVATVRAMESVVNNLNPGEEYLFRVFAINDKGKSDPRELALPVTAKDLVIEPDVRPVFSNYSVRVGKDFKVEIPIVGRPKPAVKWTKDGSILLHTSRVKISNTPDSTTLSITEATGEDGGMYGINVTNVVGEKNATIEIIALDKPGPPSGPVKFDEVTINTATISWGPPKYSGGCQISNYIVQKRDTTTTTWENVAASVARTTLKVQRLKTGAEYQFRIIAQNRYGKSYGLDSHPLTIKYPYKEPGPPGTPFIASLSKEYMVVEWHEPVADGGSSVLGYHLERKERNSILWTKLNKSLVKDTTYKTGPLEEAVEYEFRVYAENIVGIGRCSKISEGCVARDPCDPPGTPEAIIVNKESITIEWTKPEYDGGSVITGYVVEKRDLPEGRWMKANFTNVIETRFTATGLTADAQYDFRVIAKNAVGTFSKPSYNSGPITANDEVEAPRYSIDPAFTKTIIINAGDTFKLDADVHGKPVPTIQWFKDDVEIEKNTMRLEIKNTESIAMIVVKDSVRVDGGNYKLVLTNVAGSELVPFKVTVLDRPGPPVGSLHVTGVACDKCTLSWRAPLHDGGSNITHYLIERRETSRLAWTMVSNSCETTVYKVTSLLEGNEYIFRVMAINSYGIGEHVESSAVIMKNPFVVPGAPHVNDVTNIARDSMTVCYSAPETDGGSDITTYIIEKKDRAGVKWTKCNRQKVTDLSFRVTGLTSDHEYEFRVSAENAAGVGEPSLPTSYFKACDPKYKPGAPTHAHVIDTTKSSITVAWGKPLNDGGSPIQGYIVEICKAEEEEWTMCTPPTGLRVNKFEITKLTEGQEYQIQVCAINKLGVGELAAVSGTSKPEEKVEDPEIQLDSELRKGILKKLSIDSCDRSDSGKYNVTVKNSSGTVSEFVTVKVLDTPGAPLNLKLTEIKKDSITLVWDAPLTDGGAKIKNYVVDKRESIRKAFANVTTKVNKTTYKVENLVEGAMYYFRVMAENEYGIGSSTETKLATKASEVPLPVGKIFLTDVTKVSASFGWEKPEHDGGSRITGYLVEMQQKGGDKWGVATSTKGDCHGTVTGLTAGQEYLIRIIAYNEKGKSEPKALAMPVVANDMTIEPSLKLMFNTYTVKAGDDLIVEIPVFGRPKPQIVWKKEGLPLKMTTRVNVINTATTATIKITEACKDDFGKYTITATNTAGSFSEDIGITILDKPGPPTGPIKVLEVSNNSVSLSWGAPEYTGGCQVKHYNVERRDTTQTTWQSVNAQLARTAIKITKLKTGAEYCFRICAENRYGKGAPLDTKSILVQYPYKSPGPPGTPYIKSATKDQMIIEWNEPVNDGGSAVIGYHLESKERTSIMWTKLNKALIADTSFKICNLEEDIGYEYRVYAENIVGIGRASKISESFVARDPVDLPGTPEATVISKNHIVIQWTKPLYDGGSKITGYIVERRDLANIEGRWMRANFTNVIETEFSISGLTENEQYEFRVIARNAAGIFSEPSDSTGPITATDEIEAPRASMDPKYKDVIVVNAGDNLVLDADIYGKPAPEVLWLKEGKQMDKALRIEVKTTQKLTARNPYKPPSAPGTPEASQITKDSMVLSWSKPENNGGAEINCYHLEKRDKDGVRWTKCNRQPLTDLHFKVTGLLDGHFYEYRVSAENEAGVGDLSELSLFYRACNATTAPGPPHHPKVTDHTSSTVSLTWGKPASDGGAYIKGYIVEM
uniref:Titin n=1 Tax=Salmo trutta TaxID=8032 RepID=A0A674F3Z2_SALTR